MAVHEDAIPNSSAASVNWNEFNSKGYLMLNTSTGETDSMWGTSAKHYAPVDPSNADAMKSVTQHWFDGYCKYGVKAIWMDESEPDHTQYISGGQWRMKAGLDAEVLPAWVKYWSKGFADKMKQLRGEDYFILSRNAWAGTPAHGTALWSGDIRSTFAELQMQVTVAQGVAMSGIPLWTSDIGGYQQFRADLPHFPQLIVRWFQFGAFCPLFRLHGHRQSPAPPPNECGSTNGDNEVWNLAPQPDHYTAIEAVMHLRENLRDYVVRLNDETVRTGMPMLRPMMLQFPKDEQCHTAAVEAQFMFGPDWLIAPVTA